MKEFCKADSYVKATFKEMALDLPLRPFTRRKHQYYLHKSSAREGTAASTPEVRHVLMGRTLVGHPVFGNSSARDPLGEASLASSHSAAAATDASLRHHVLAASLAPSAAPESSADTLLASVLDNVVCKSGKLEICTDFRLTHATQKCRQCKHAPSVRVSCVCPHI